MRKILCLIALFPIFDHGFGQNLQVNLLLKGNLAFPTINDETYTRPAPVDPNTAYVNYYLTPADVSRKTLARPGMELGVDLKWKIKSKWHFGTGLRARLIRYRIESEYKVPEIGPYQHVVDSLHGTPYGNLYGYDFTRPNPSAGVAGQLSDLGINTSLFYLSLPLLLEYQIKKSFFLSAGMELSTLLSARQNYNRVFYHYDSPMVTISEKQISDRDKTGFSTVQANVRAGAHYQLTEKITLDASLSGGLVNMYSNANETGKNSTFKSRLRTAALGLSYTIR